MDARFLRDDKFIAIVALSETFVMGPLCIIVALLYKTEKIVSFLNNIIKILREVLAIVVSSFQICGTVVFCA